MLSSMQLWSDPLQGLGYKCEFCVHLQVYITAIIKFIFSVEVVLCAFKKRSVSQAPFSFYVIANQRWLWCPWTGVWDRCMVWYILEPENSGKIYRNSDRICLYEGSKIQAKKILRPPNPNGSAMHTLNVHGWRILTSFSFVQLILNSSAIILPF